MSKRIGYKIGEKINGLVYNGNESIILYNCGKKMRNAEFICKCGNYFTTSINNVKRGHTNSCGCYQKENMQKISTTHGQCRNGVSTSEYNIWVCMKDRCNNFKNIGFKNYGGRGIKVCDRWLNSFENFFKDMGKRPSLRYSLDRFPDNDGNYEPSNCRWATRKEQANNKRLPMPKNLIWFNNEEKSLAGWCRELGLNYQNAVYRIKAGWSIDKTFSTKNGEYRKKNYRIKFSMNGQEMYLPQWAATLNVKYVTLKGFLYKHSFEEAYDRYKNKCA